MLSLPLLTCCTTTRTLDYPEAWPPQKTLSSDCSEISGTYSNVCSCAHTLRSRSISGCSLTTLMQEGDVNIDKKAQIVTIRRSDHTHIEIVGLSFNGGVPERTYFLESSATCTPSGLEVVLPKRPALGMGMVGGVPLFSAGINSDTLRLSHSEDQSLIIKYINSERNMILFAIPCFEDHASWCRCKKLSSILPSNGALQWDTPEARFLPSR